MSTWRERGKKILVGSLVVLSFAVGGIGLSSKMAEAAPVFAKDHTIVEMEKPEYILKEAKLVVIEAEIEEKGHEVNTKEKEMVKEETPMTEQKKEVNKGPQSESNEERKVVEETEQVQKVEKGSDNKQGQKEKASEKKKEAKQVAETPVNQATETKEEPKTPLAIQQLQQSILHKSGNNYTYSVDGMTVLTVKTNGKKITSITFDGMLYYIYDYANEKLLINEHGEKEGKKLYQQYKQAMKNMELALQQATKAAGGGYEEVLNGGQKGVYTKNY